MNDIIDIVLPWVNPNDSEWQAEKKRYLKEAADEEDTRDIRYRDWDNLKYVFRSIEKFAPWINKIHFITCGHLPDWLDTDNEKLNIVKHSDYIPSEFLPTFSSHVIELNMNKIQGLSEQFIYFNDDIFLIKPTKPSDFFKKGLPCDCNTSTIIVPSMLNFSSIVFKSVAYVNKNIEKKRVIKNNPGKWINISYGITAVMRNVFTFASPGYTGFKNYHLAVSYLKSTLDEVWKREPGILIETSNHRFRDINDVNQYIFRYWQLASGNFSPSKVNGKYFKISDNNEQILNYIAHRKGLMVCINDDEFNGDFESVKMTINECLNQLFPEKSSYEK